MLEQVNAVEYGLTASIWTNDLSTAHRTAGGGARPASSGSTRSRKHFLGAPFGGYKQSGIGREECFEEMLAYTQEKNIHVQAAAGQIAVIPRCRSSGESRTMITSQAALGAENLRDSILGYGFRARPPGAARNDVRPETKA